MEVRIDRLETLRAVTTHVISDSPEEDAWHKMKAWAIPRGLFEKGSGTRVFGRNTYPTNEPEPHGYEFFLTIGPDIEPLDDIDVKEISGGSYAVLRFKNLNIIGDAWNRLFTWIEESEYERVGWRKSEHGWVDGYEENLDPFGGLPPEDWVFDLWVKLKE